MENQNAQTTKIENPKLVSNPIPNQPPIVHKKSKLMYVFLGLFILLVLTILASIGVNLYKSSRAKISPTPSLSLRASPSPTQTIDTSSWKTYTSDKYHFSVMYPAGIDPKVFPLSKYDTFSFRNNDLTSNGINIHITPMTLNTSEDLKTWLMENTHGSTGPINAITPPPPTIYPYTNSIYNNITGYWEEGGAESVSKNIYLKKGNAIFEFSVAGMQTGDNYKPFLKGQETLEKMISTFKTIN